MGDWWLRWYRICLQCGRPKFNLSSGSGRPSREGNGYPLQYSCLEKYIRSKTLNLNLSKLVTLFENVI